MNGKKQRKLAEVRKNSHELFMEAKRRFQYRPEGKKFETKGSEPINSPECSSVTDVCRQEHSNDFSWLDKMVNGFDWYNSKEERRRSHVGTTSGQQNQTAGITTSNVTSSTTTKPNYFSKKPAVLGQRSLNRPSTANQSYNGSSGNNNGKPVIKRSLQRLIHGSHVTSRNNNQGKQKKQLHQAIVKRKNQVEIHEFDPKGNMDDGFVEQQECPQLFPEADTKKDDLAQLMKNLATEPAEMDVTILKLEEAKPKQESKAVFPTPEKSPEQPRNKPMGKIKKNMKKQKNTIPERNVSEKKPVEQKPVAQVELTKAKPIYVPQPSRLSSRRQTVPNPIPRTISPTPLTNTIATPEPILKTSIVTSLKSPSALFEGHRSSSFNKAPIQYCPQTIQEEQEERSCQTSGRLQQKFCQIFHELDEKHYGHIDKKNCYSDSLNDEIRYLIGPILTKIKYQDKRYNLQTFVEEGKKIISALETHEISKLMKCSVLNRFFYLDTKRSDHQRMTTRVLGLSAEKVERKSCSTIVRTGKFDLLDVDSVNLPKKDEMQTGFRNVNQRNTGIDNNRVLLDRNIGMGIQDRNVSFGDKTACLAGNYGLSLGNLSIIKTIETSRAKDVEKKVSPNKSEPYQIIRNRSHSRSHSRDLSNNKEQPPANPPLGHLRKNSGTTSEDKLICRGGITREPYLRLSTGKSMDKLRQQHIEQIRRTLTPDARDQKPRLQDLSRQAYLFRQSRLSPRLETSQLDRSLQQNPDEAKYSEKDEYNRIDLLNERLNKYIRENHLKETMRQDKYETLSLQFAQLKKHLSK